jgi:hypothetical protein
MQSCDLISFLNPASIYPDPIHRSGTVFEFLSSLSLDKKVDTT